MALYLDSASPDDARRSARLGYVSGVTTNPTLMAATGRPASDVIPELCDIHPGPVFFQPVAATVEEREREVRAMVALRPGRIVLKLPSEPENFVLARRLVDDGFAVGMTAIFDPAQVLVACAAGVGYVLPYVNRSSRLLGDGPGLVARMRAVVDACGGRVEILAASIKTPEEAVATTLAGAHSMTLSLAVLEALSHHELSDRAIAEFAESAASATRASAGS